MSVLSRLGFRKSTKKKPEALSSMSIEKRREIEEMLNEGVAPQDIALETDTHILNVYTISRSLSRRAQRAKKYANMRMGKTDAQDRVAQLEEQIQLERAQTELERVRADRAYEREKQELELEIRRAELQDKRASMFDMDGDEDDILSNLMPFLTTLLLKQQAEQKHSQTFAESPPRAEAPLTVQHTNENPTSALSVVDLTAPITREQMRNLIDELYSPAQLMLARSISPKKLGKEIRKRMPDMHPDNVELAVQEVHHEG